MTNRLRRSTPHLWLLAITGTLAAVACGSDQSAGQSGPAGGNTGRASAGTGGASSASGGTSGASGGTPGASGGTPGASGGTSGASGGTSGAGAGGAPSGGGGTTAGSGGTAQGSDAGTSPVPIGCRAPVKSAAPGNACKNAAPPAVKLTPVVTQGLARPVFVTQAPGDPSRLFVVQHRGIVRVIKGGVLEAAPFLDISSIVGGAGVAGEQGLLGLAFDPNYQKTGRFWVKYSATTGNGADTVAAYQGTPGQAADPKTGKILAEISTNHPSPIGNHNGGMLAFGHDGCLYISYGDGGGAGDPTGTGQNPGDVFGSLLRIDVDKFPTPAPGNMTGQNVNPHLWDYGLRNPWRFSFDSASGDLYIGDVGQDAWEEVDVEPAQTGHRNYGWNVMEGKHCYNAATCDQTGLTLPVTEYANPPGSAQAAVNGGYVYRGSAIPGMVGRYVYADTYSMKLSSFVWSGDGKICDEFPLNVTAAGAITSFGQDLAGEIYVVTYDGGIYRLDPA